LPYFVQFLDHPDRAISNDAYAELMGAPVNVLQAVSETFPREKLRRWLVDPKLPVTRQSGYGMMLGMCGDADDARLLEKRMASRDLERQIGIEGVIFGYLLLAGEPGLARIEKLRLANPDVSDGEVFAAVHAIQRYWEYSNAKIGRQKLQQAIHLLIDRPALSDTAITTLARCKDWSVQDRLMRLYDTLDLDDKSTKRAIVCYLIASTSEVPKAGSGQPDRATAAAQYLKQLREKDPNLVIQTERFFLLQ
jgi:hypothetical protein